MISLPFIFVYLFTFCIGAHLPHLYLLSSVRAFQSLQLLPLQLADLKKLNFICRLGGFHCALLSRSVKMLNRMIPSNAARSAPLLTLLCSGKLTIKSHHCFLVFSQFLPIIGSFLHSLDFLPQTVQGAV